MHSPRIVVSVNSLRSSARYKGILDQSITNQYLMIVHVCQPEQEVV